MLETEQFLEQAVDFLIEQTGENKQQTKTLTDFVIQKAKDNRSWDIAYDLNKIASLVYNENHYKQLRQMSNKTWTDFLQLQKQLQTHKASCVEVINNRSKSLYEKVIDSKIDEASFSHKELLSQLEKGQSENPISIPSNRLRGQNENQQLLKKSASQHEQDALEPVCKATSMSGLMRLLINKRNKPFLTSSRDSASHFLPFMRFIKPHKSYKRNKTKGC